MNRFIKVKDVVGAVRDTNSGAVLFKSKTSSQALARRRYAQKLKNYEKEKVEMEARINRLEQIVKTLIPKENK